MPLCPRCGKNLSTEQAVTYHLNKKYKCGSLKCHLCTKPFTTKFDLNIHLLSNCNEYQFIEKNNVSKCNDVLVIEYKNNYDIQNISSNSLELIGYSNNDDVAQIIKQKLCENGDIVYTHKNGNTVRFKRVFHNNHMSIDMKII